MKLIKLLLLIATTTISLNLNVFAMQEPSAPPPYMDEMKEGPCAPRMDDHERSQQPTRRNTKLLCKDCLCSLCKFSAMTGCSIACILGALWTDHACWLCHQGRGDFIEHITCLNGAGPCVCYLGAGGAVLYSVYGLWQFCADSRRLGIRVDELIENYLATEDQEGLRRRGPVRNQVAEATLNPAEPGADQASKAKKE